MKATRKIWGLIYFCTLKGAFFSAQHSSIKWYKQTAGLSPMVTLITLVSSKKPRTHSINFVFFFVFVTLHLNRQIPQRYYFDKARNVCKYKQNAKTTK